MKGRKEVIDILNEALKHELRRQAGLAIAACSTAWGSPSSPRRGARRPSRKQRADKLVVRIVFLEGLPIPQSIAPLMIG
jgi:bacterioferritin (cytochrome b1)